jgi:hypothetical protein
MVANLLSLLHDHKDELLVFTSLAAVCVSLSATLIGPIIQMRVARLNTRTSVLISGRVKWIESVQSNIASLVALIERAEFLDKSMKEIRQKYPQFTDEQSEEFARMLKEHEERTFERNKISALIGLLLDVPTEKRDKLFRAITAYAHAVPGMSTDSPELVAALDEVQYLTREVLKEEWTWVRREVRR